MSGSWSESVRRLASGILGALLLASCAVQTVASYDEATDVAVSELQRKTEMHLLELKADAGLPECDYAHHRAFYLDARVDVSAIAVRAAAIPHNELTVQQTALLENSFDSLEKLHRLACLEPEQIDVLRSQFATSFTAILKLELAKRRE